MLSNRKLQIRRIDNIRGESYKIYEVMEFNKTIDKWIGIVVFFDVVDYYKSRYVGLPIEDLT